MACGAGEGAHVRTRAAGPRPRQALVPIPRELPAYVFPLSTNPMSRLGSDQRRRPVDLEDPLPGRNPGRAYPVVGYGHSLPNTLWNTVKSEMFTKSSHPSRS